MDRVTYFPLCFQLVSNFSFPVLPLLLFLNGITAASSVTQHFLYLHIQDRMVNGSQQYTSEIGYDAKYIHCDTLHLQSGSCRMQQYNGLHVMTQRIWGLRIWQWCSCGFHSHGIWCCVRRKSDSSILKAMHSSKICQDLLNLGDGGSTFLAKFWYHYLVTQYHASDERYPQHREYPQIRGSHSSVAENSSFLGCDAMSYKWFTTFLTH